MHDKITNLNSMQPAVMVTRWDSSKKPKFEINVTNGANIINVINNDMNAVLQTTSADRNVINNITNKLSNAIIDCANRSGMVRKLKNIMAIQHIMLIPNEPQNGLMKTVLKNT